MELDRKDYENISAGAKRNLLLGNGFSIGVDRKFHYSSLLSVGSEHGYLTPEVDGIFTSLNTCDFELVLNRLRITENINGLIGLDSKPPRDLYGQVSEALIECVREVHPDFFDLDENWVQTASLELGGFQDVFTTNYDLLLYWLMAENRFSGFSDLFWPSGNPNASGLVFDPQNTELWRKDTRVLYLHGALFLWFNDYYTTKLRTSSVRDLLRDVEQSLRSGQVPVFVSKGSSHEKLRAIYTNPYLSFVFRELGSTGPGITIFGNSLSDTDQHIVDTLNKNRNIEYIAYSLYIGDRDEEDLCAEQDRIWQKLGPFRRRDGVLEFFDSSTCPLSYDP